MYYEHLGVLFYNKGEFRKAVKFYEMYMTVDSLHPRILANLAESYKQLGDEKNHYKTLQRSVAAGSKNPGVYSNLSLQYMERGDTVGAISLLNEALRLDSNFSTAHANLAVMDLATREYAAARLHANRAIQLGMREPILYRVIGYSSYYLHDYPNALASLKEYVKLAPADEKVRAKLKELEQRIGSK
jgi:Flp pilus assembly protein TadD